MKILIVLGHPDSNSLNHAIAHAVKDDLLNDGHDVMFHETMFVQKEKKSIPDIMNEDL